jgi:hypothetical protein
MATHQITPKQSIRKRSMKKYQLWLLVIFLICTSAIINLKGNETQQTVNKNISFIVYKSIDYTSSVYNNTYVQLKITVEKVNNSKRTLVLDKTFDVKLVREYPTLDNAFTQVLSAQNVQDIEEQLVITYTRTYNSHGYKLQLYDTVVIDKSPHYRLDISI